MKVLLHRITTFKSLVFSAALLLLAQNSAYAGVRASQTIPSLTRSREQEFARDLVQPNASQDFFLRGQQNLEREIELLRQGQLSSKQHLLKIDRNAKSASP